MGLLLRGCELADRSIVDVRVVDGRVVEIGQGLTRSAGELDVNAGGGALLPGLHDHHLHLLATAAAETSVSCGPRSVTSAAQLAAKLQQAATTAVVGGWVRGINYHEHVAGTLDRHVLDAWVPDQPLRVQHQSGTLWMLNSAGLSALGIDQVAELPTGVERDETGQPTGRLWGVDGWMRRRLAPRPPPDLAGVASRLARLGITGVTDATPDLDGATMRLFLDAVAEGALPQRLTLMGTDEHELKGLLDAARAPVAVGPRKLVLADHDLPTLPALVDRIRHARSTRPDRARPVAVHCVTRVALVLLLSALDQIGSVPGDRVEHASVVPAELLPRLARLRLTVVTQPALVTERGDTYLTEVTPEDLPGLYRHASLLDAGIAVGLSTDAPYTEPNPWATIRAAIHRTTPTGHLIGPDERVDPTTALAGFTTPAQAPGGTPRQVNVGAAADLCLLDQPHDVLARAGETPHVQLTVVAGRVIYCARRN